MSTKSPARRLAEFESCRKDLVGLAYRMLGDLGRAEDMVQEAWLRWERAEVDADSPRAYLTTVITRLCLNELESARARREESRPDRLPEPVDLDDGGLSRVERLEDISMAFLVVLQRLTPAERAVLLLHDVFDFDHQEIAGVVGNNAASCRKLLERARRHITTERRMLVSHPDEHRRLLQAFLSAALAGDTRAIVELLADDAMLISDGGAEGRVVGRQRNLPRPLQGAARIAAFVVATRPQAGNELQIEEQTLNGQPALVFWTGARPFAALLLAVADGKIQRVFFHGDLSRLQHLGPRTSTRKRPPARGNAGR
jgi:RNA polymerase sigma-70 factor (ECF subfamily)